MEHLSTYLNLPVIFDNITLYTIFFYGSLFFPVVAVFILTKFYSIQREKFILQYFGSVYILFIFLLIAFRPIGVLGFTDSQMYMNWFTDAKLKNIIPTKDIGFGLLVFLVSKIFTVRVFFVICTLLSFGTLFFISKIIAGRYWFLFFFGFMVSLYFWNHQVFTIRQGLASLFFLLGLFVKKPSFKIVLLVIAVSFHKSFLLPFIVYFIILYVNKRTIYLLFWVISIPISYFFGKDFGNLISMYLPLNINYYFPKTSDSLDIMSYRWDVILYSSIFVILPHYYRCKDEKYLRVCNLFLLTNVFVILLIWPAGGYIHRFAYLSWFLCPIIIYYPIFINKKMPNFDRYFKTVTVFYIMVLFYMGLKLYKQNFKLVEDHVVSITANYNKINIFK